MCSGSISSAESASRGAARSERLDENGVQKLAINASSRRVRFSAISATEYFGSTPRNNGRSPACRLRSTKTVREELQAARFVARNDVPQPPLLENTATIRPFFLGASTWPAENSPTRSIIVVSSSWVIGRRRNSRAPARKLCRIRSGEAFCAAEITAVPGDSDFKRWMNLIDCSALPPRAMIAAAGLSRTISSKSCSGSFPPARSWARLSLDNAARISLKFSSPVLRTTNVNSCVILLACWNCCWSRSGGFAGQCRGVIGHSDRGADNWNNEFKIVFLDDDLYRPNIHSKTLVKNVYIVCR